MRLRLIFLLALVVAFSSVARAQLAGYVLFSGANTGLANANWEVGPTIGLYGEHSAGGLLGLGVDLRGVILAKNGDKLDSGLVGPRLSFHPKLLRISPYTEFLFGMGHTFVPAQGSAAQIEVTKFEYSLLGGVDYTLVPRLDWRVIEFSYGGFSAFTGSYHPKMLSSGLVLRF
jgi:hypothetical protein